MVEQLTLVSHHLCPYVQRAVVSLTEKKVPHERVYVDLSNKPDWLLTMSPLGKTPVLKIGNRAIFESAVILEYLEETQPCPLHPMDPLSRAEHRSWIEFSSSILNDIAGFYNAPNEETFLAKADTMNEKFGRLEKRVMGRPWFEGERFHLVDAVFGPVFRYFDTFDQIGDFGMFAGRSKLIDWRLSLAERPSIQSAVPGDYSMRLREFLGKRNSYLSTLMP